ncbi:H/ACA ribonucleoprotein complex subunit GAR1 [Pyrolobus fumarii]|uniref:H/ACA ribonucleoprotein complex subunit GAR1 n=1 Tax=Pyrolobus fumarii TaxID=54252 RepID=UPI00064E8204|nr:Gar1/Naf1 family protein [Pyrolobus fumarii]
MRKLGVVLHATRNGYIVVKPEDTKQLPPLGIPVYDRELRKKYGTILDVIGPVDNPLIVVKPESKEILKTVKSGEELYYVPPRPPRRRKRRGGGRPSGRRGKGGRRAPGGAGERRRGGKG